MGTSPSGTKARAPTLAPVAADGENPPAPPPPPPPPAPGEALPESHKKMIYKLRLRRCSKVCVVHQTWASYGPIPE